MRIEGEKDIEQLRRIALAQKTQIEHLVKVIETQSEHLDALRGTKGELQQALAFVEKLNARAKRQEERAKKKEKKERKKREKFGPTEQPNLEHVELVCELDEADQFCTACGGALEEMKDQDESSQMVDVVEISYRLVQVKQKKYRCRCGGCVETALGPERAVAGGRYSLDFGIKVAIDKYLDHLPLERQVRILKRHGLKVTSQTLWDQIASIATDLEPAYEELRRRILAQPVIGLDQTSWKRLDKKKATPWQMWCLTAPDAILHTIRDDKSEATFRELVGDFEGTIVCDDLGTHSAGARGSPGIQLAGCWAHVLRRFREAEPNHSEANLALEWIRELYALDDEAGDNLVKKAELRDTRSRDICSKLFTWLGTLEVLRSTEIGSAARYTYDNKRMLERFLDDARIPLDNNGTERAIRGPVVGRKNHYGSRSRRGTVVASIFYSLLETAKLRETDPAAFLRDTVLAARRGEMLLPGEPRRN